MADGGPKKMTVAELEALAKEAGYDLIKLRAKTTRKTFDITESCWEEFNSVRITRGMSIKDSLEEALAVWIKTHRQT